MKKFEFRLDRVMDAYQAQEQDALRKYSQAMQLLTHEKNRLEEIRENISERSKEIRQKSQNTMQASEALMDSLYTEKLRQDESSIKIEVNNQQKKVNTRRIELTEAVRRRKVVELLREKKLEEYNADLKKQEQIEADEVTAQQFAKKDNNRNAA